MIILTSPFDYTANVLDSRIAGLSVYENQNPSVSDVPK
jgi:hypothetical protein